MKLSKILLILILAATVVSCDKKDDDNSYDLTNENVAGGYDLVFFTAITVETTDVNGLEVVSTFTDIGDTFDVAFDFDENGTYEATGLFRIVSTTVVNGETTEEDAYIETVEVLDGTFSTNASSSILTLDGDPFEVTLFDQDEMRIIFEEFETLPNGDTEMTTAELRFVRQ
ncbi:MAG: hypothetical protein ACI86C_000295 [Candidatus Latescibacterota bacterium]|jgi:hypothetical protein